MSKIIWNSVYAEYLLYSFVLNEAFRVCPIHIYASAA